MFGFKKNEIKNEEERKQRELGLDKINPKKRKAKKLSIGKTIAIGCNNIYFSNSSNYSNSTSKY